MSEQTSGPQGPSAHGNGAQSTGQHSAGPQNPATHGAGPPSADAADRAAVRPLVAALRDPAVRDAVVRDAATPDGASPPAADPAAAEASFAAAAVAAMSAAVPRADGDNPALVKLYWHLAVTGILTFAGFMVALMVARFGVFSDLLLLVLLAGSTGAVINNYYRLAKLACADSASVPEMDNSVFTVQLYVSVLIAGVLGFVMYGLCVSGLIAGDLFPAFQGVQADYASVTDLMARVSPASNVDAAKAVVWAFIAGFSEKMIPNMIDRVASRAETRAG